MGITPQQFGQLQKRLSARKPSVAPVFQPTIPVDTDRHQVVLGIDPSMRGTGYGVIRLERPTPRPLGFGTVKCPATWPHSRCLLRITQELREAIRAHRPTVCVVEGLFFAQNLQTAIIMGEARGAALVAAAEGGLDIHEVAPRKVKQAIVGHGAAQKSAVARMVQRMLGLAEPPPPDAADALALALTYGQGHLRFGVAGTKLI